MQNSVVEKRLYFNTDKLRFGALHNLRTTINTQTQTNAFQVIPHLQSLQLWDRSSSHHSRKQPWEINIRLNPKQASRWNKGRNSPVNIWSIIKHLLPSLKQGITVLRQVDRHFEPVQSMQLKREASDAHPVWNLGWGKASLALAQRARGKKILLNLVPRVFRLPTPKVARGTAKGRTRRAREEKSLPLGVGEEMKDSGNEVVFFSLLACLEPVVQLTMTSKGKSFK